MVTHKHWLTLILLLYLLLGVAYSWVVPLGEAPDEVDHFLYVRYLLEERAFPVMRPVAADNEPMEANQPPLFYLLNAAVTASFPMTAPADLPLNACFTFDPYDGGRAHFYLHDAAEAAPFAPDYLAFRVARLFSVLLGAVVVWLAYRLGRQLVPDDGRVGLLAAGLLAFNPQFLFMMASVNNDVLTAVLGAAILTFSIQAALNPSPRLFALLGGLVGLGLLTKFALLAFWPLPVLAAIWPVIRYPLAVFRNPHSALRTPKSEISSSPSPSPCSSPGGGTFAPICFMATRWPGTCIFRPKAPKCCAPRR
jgi:4-amino-4-deoxy-L-arabinose transferase-like glycosyltransferase